MSDLFDAAARDRLAARAPLASRLRPRTLDEVVGQRHLVGPGAPLRALVERDRVTSVVLWGPPGSGKTTLARLIAAATEKELVSLSAVSAGVKDVRDALEGARRRLGESGRGTLLFVDEVHRFNKAQQDVLLPAVEDGLVVLVGATTENPFFEVNPPLMSRTTLWRLEPIDDHDMAVLVGRGFQAEGARPSDEAVIEAIVGAAAGDARAALTTLEVAVALAGSRPGAEPPFTVVLDDVSRARTGRIVHQGIDAHYDQISAFIKSVRGSDPDAALYWMARMLEAGEDPRFVARRLVVLASEDIGLADPLSLLVADAAARAVELVGLPEAGLNLAQATIHLACAPKSNSVVVALARASADVDELPGALVPAHLRDAHAQGARHIGHGEGYRYPHDDPSGWVAQQYRPDALEGHRYYEPTDHGNERAVSARLDALGDPPAQAGRDGAPRDTGSSEQGA